MIFPFPTWSPCSWTSPKFVLFLSNHLIQSKTTCISLWFMVGHKLDINKTRSLTLSKLCPNIVQPKKVGQMLDICPVFVNPQFFKALISKTVNPFDPRQQFCQYQPRDYNLTANFLFCLFLAPSNQSITKLGPLLTKQIVDLLCHQSQFLLLSLSLGDKQAMGEQILRISTIQQSRNCIVCVSSQP